MRKKSCIIILLTSLFLIISSINVFGLDADDNGFEIIDTVFTYYSGGSSQSDQQISLPLFYILYDYTGFLSEYTDEILLKTPNNDYSYYGVFVDDYDAFGFYMETISPSEGEYVLEIIRDNNRIVEESFTLSYDFDAHINSIEWYCLNPDSSFSSNNKICEDEADSIRGVNVNFSISNSGTLPFSVGDRYRVELPIEYCINVTKKESNELVMSTDFNVIKRKYGLIHGNNAEKCYLKPNETIFVEEKITLNSGDLEIDNFDQGEYNISGEINMDNQFYPIQSEISLQIEADDSIGTPGFGIILLISSILIILGMIRKNDI